jgi:hypothetical protein
MRHKDEQIKRSHRKNHFASEAAQIQIVLLRMTDELSSHSFAYARQTDGFESNNAIQGPNRRLRCFRTAFYRKDKGRRAAHLAANPAADGMVCERKIRLIVKTH